MGTFVKEYKCCDNQCDYCGGEDIINDVTNALV